VIEKVARIAFLLDFYGGLLTDKQQHCLDLHYNNDMSLAEIADVFGVSRQAVHDILKRAEYLLEDYERRLRLVERFSENRNQLSNVLERLTQLKKSARPDAAVWEELDNICFIIEKLMDQQ
jgi:predicted DNA-binding protein YlxM (UPF0122 family)